MKWWVLAFLLLFTFISSAQDSTQSTTDTSSFITTDTTIHIMHCRSYLLGTDTIRFCLSGTADMESPVILLNVHDDENTATEAGAALLSSTGGQLLELRHLGTRNLHFAGNGNEYKVDPNRIYTPAGRKASLTVFNSYTPSVAKQVAAFADTLVQLYLANKKLVIALHNNTQGGLSINSYRRGGTEAKNASRVYMNPEMDVDDFVLTTIPAVFDHLKKVGINAVLQHQNPKDDGSFSVYAARHKIGYINVEAEHGHFEEQLSMLQALQTFFSP